MIRAKAMVKQTINDLQPFIRNVILITFGAPKLLVKEGGPKLVANTNNVYITNHLINQSLAKTQYPQINGRFRRLDISLTKTFSRQPPTTIAPDTEPTSSTHSNTGRVN